MTEQQKTNTEQFIARCHVNKDFIRLDDGLFCYWPEGSGGAYTEYGLTILLAELQRLNAPHKAELDAYFEGQKGNHQ